MRVARAGNVAALVRRAPGRRIGQREAAIHDDPIGAAEVARQSVDVDERTECHRDIVASHGPLAPELLESPRDFRARSRSLQTIMVGIKRVVDYNVRVRVKPDGSGMATEGLKMSINPFDEIAIEAALRLKETGAFAQVLLVTIGPAEAEQQLAHRLGDGRGSRDPRRRARPSSSR